MINEMSETLISIIDSYHSGLLSIPNFQISGKTFSDEIINFPDELIADLSFDSSTFQNSHFINMKFINVNFESSFFEKCLIQNCIFEKNSLRSAEYDKCVFSNCFLIDCDLNESDLTETIFKECTFLRGNINNGRFESCHFVKTIFKDLKGGSLGAAVLINSKFSNSKKSIEFEGDVYFNDVFNQIKKLELD